MKVGDKILCKKTYKYYPNAKVSFIKKKFGSNILFKKNKFYEIEKIEDLGEPELEISARPRFIYVVKSEFGKGFTINDEKFYEYFYTPKEIRKLKLEKIKKSR